MAVTRPQSAHIMNTGEENGTEYHPQNGRNPTPVYGDSRPDDGSSTRYGGKVVTP